MNFTKKIKRFKLLTTTPSFAEWIAQSGREASSVLHARLVYSWLVFRSRHNFGSSTRALCRELGLHPSTAANAVNSLTGLIERRNEQWVALPPPEGLFITWNPESECKHWSDGVAYLTLLLPRKGAVIKYPTTSRRFGLNHALIYSYLIGRANNKTSYGTVRKFTMAGAAKLFALDPKTVGSIIEDLLWVSLIQRVDRGRCSDITVTTTLTDAQLDLFEPKVEPVRKVVEPKEKQPRSTPAPFVCRGDNWDACRRLCDGHMPQKRAEDAIAKARRLSMTPDDFEAEFHKLLGFHKKNIMEGKVGRGNFGKYLATCLDSRVAMLEVQERKEQERERLEAYYRSPEFKQLQKQEEKSAATNPLHPKFFVSEEAIQDRVQLDESPVLAYRKLDTIKDRLHRHVREFVKSKNLNSQDEVDEIGNLKGRILRHTLAALNGYYKQPVLATQGQFEQAIDEAIAKVEPTMPPLFARS
jgi:hypothetical protein